MLENSVWLRFLCRWLDDLPVALLRVGELVLKKLQLINDFFFNILF